MRKRRWLAIALFAMVAPAAWVFFSDLYYLTAPNKDYRKEQLLYEVQAAKSRSGGSGGWLGFILPPPRPSGPVVVISVPYEPPKQLFEKLVPCDDTVLHNVEVSWATEAPIRKTDAAVYLRGPVFRRNYLHEEMAIKHLRSNSMSATQIAAINACFRATPFHDLCKDAYGKHEPNEDAVIALLIERKVIRDEADGLCWARPIFKLIEDD